MSLDHDLENLPRLSDEDREALDNPYIVMPSVQSDEAIAMRDDARAKMQAFSGDELTRIYHVHGELEYVDSLVAVVGDLLAATDEECTHLLNQIVLIRKMVWKSRDALGALIGLPGDAKEASHD